MFCVVICALHRRLDEACGPETVLVTIVFYDSASSP